MSTPASSPLPVLSVRNLSKRYPMQYGQRNLKSFLTGLLRKRNEAEQPKHFMALDDITFDVYKGERVGIIGHNGAGKSTLLKILSRIVYPSHGEARIRGRITSLLEVGTGFSQNLTGRENIYLSATMQGMTAAEVDVRLEEIIQFSGVGKFLDMPIKFYSSGMRARLGFSVAAHLDPDILLLDEVLSVGDAAFRNKCLQKMENLTSTGQTVLFVSHTAGQVLRFCDRVIWLDHGKIRFDGDAAGGVAAYEEFNKIGGVSKDISEVTDRRGTGMARFSKVSILDEQGRTCAAVQTGDSFYFALEYTFNEALPEKIFDVQVVISIETQLGQRVLAFSNEVLDVDLTNLRPSGRFLFHVHRLPLLAESYKILLSLHVNRQLVDRVGNAGTLLVREGDYFRTGHPPQYSYAPVCTEFDLSMDSAG
jgi:lipopolysaccharide transport system ATP-binding protein